MRNRYYLTSITVGLLLAAAGAVKVYADEWRQDPTTSNCILSIPKHDAGKQVQWLGGCNWQGHAAGHGILRMLNHNGHPERIFAGRLASGSRYVGVEMTLPEDGTYQVTDLGYWANNAALPGLPPRAQAELRKFAAAAAETGAVKLPDGKALAQQHAYAAAATAARQTAQAFETKGDADQARWFTNLARELDDKADD